MELGLGLPGLLLQHLEAHRAHEAAAVGLVEVVARALDQPLEQPQEEPHVRHLLVRCQYRRQAALEARRGGVALRRQRRRQVARRALALDHYGRVQAGPVSVLLLPSHHECPPRR